MKKIIKILTLFFTLIFLYSCGSAQEALVGKKRSINYKMLLTDSISKPLFDICHALYTLVGGVSLVVRWHLMSMMAVLLIQEQLRQCQGTGRCRSSRSGL